MKRKSLGDVLEIDDVEYLITADALEALAKDAELIPLVRLFDKEIFMITKEKLEKTPVIDHLDRKS
ncbi:MAG: hypothetical protein AAB631_00765 [Patescibacteria group bacterium]